MQFARVTATAFTGASAPFFSGSLRQFMREHGVWEGEFVREITRMLRDYGAVDMHGGPTGHLILRHVRQPDMHMPLLMARVRFKAPAERYPWCTVPAGMNGVVAYVDHREGVIMVSVGVAKQPTAALERQAKAIRRELAEWNGMVQWHRDLMGGTNHGLLDWFWSEVELRS